MVSYSNESRLAARTVEDYRWRLKRKGGLIDCFGELPLDKITVDTVESFIAAKLGEDEPLSPRSINMMLTLLAAILDSARERKMIEANPATGKRRRVRERKPQRSYLDSAAGIKALLDAAATLGAKARDNGLEGHVHREALTTVLVFAGLRVSELCDLLSRHVDLAVGWLHVVDSKTDTGVRRVKIRGIVHDRCSRSSRLTSTGRLRFRNVELEGMNVSFVQAYTVPRTLPRAGQERVRGAFSASDPLW